ncbi:MAG: ferrous iron transport protein A [Gammaproteobacteria bacterium]|nr:ferrous iron transport protein A [Gammaproteobacteria bacterium]
MSTTLADLRPGEAGVVEGFAQIDETAQRLMQMGVVEGMEIEILRYAPAGDPIEVRVLGYALSLRGKEAANVLVSRSG